MDNVIPGTNIAYTSEDEVFSIFRPLMKITGGLSLGQICSITGLQSSTIQNWVKRGFVQRPVKKKYSEEHLARILLISALRDCINIDEIGELMRLINGDTEDESDNMLSESKLYEYFCKAVKCIDSQTLNDDDITNKINSLLKNEAHKVELSYALKIMVYAYITGKCFKQIDLNLNKLRAYRR